MRQIKKTLTISELSNYDRDGVTRSVTVNSNVRTVEQAVKELTQPTNGFGQIVLGQGAAADGKGGGRRRVSMDHRAYIGALPVDEQMHSRFRGAEEAS